MCCIETKAKESGHFEKASKYVILKKKNYSVHDWIESNDLIMAYEQYNVPLAGDMLDDLAMAFQELVKVCFKYFAIKSSYSVKTWIPYMPVKKSFLDQLISASVRMTR